LPELLRGAAEVIERVEGEKLCSSFAGDVCGTALDGIMLRGAT